MSTMAALPAAAVCPPAPRETQWWRVALFVVCGILILGVLPTLGGESVICATGISLDSCTTILNCSTNAWCETNSFDTAISETFRAPNLFAAEMASHVFTFGLCPLLALTSALAPLCTSGEKSHAAQDALIIVGATCLSLGVAGLAKVSFSRQRPCFHYGVQSETEASSHPAEEYTSFFSGDATIAFVTFTAGLSLAQLRQRDYAMITTGSGLPVSPMALGGGFLASMGALLRMVGLMHWTTDILVGGFVGCICGYGPPFLLFKRLDALAVDDTSVAAGNEEGPEEAADQKAEKKAEKRAELLLVV